jgi:thiamine biosynthesis lipoprotein
MTRTIHVEHCMGTVFSIDIRDAGNWSTAVAEVVEWLRQVDATFSTYQSNSAVSRLRRDEIALADCPRDVGQVLQACDIVTAETGGYFTAFPGGKLDPSGYVKGWAIERASEMLRRQGSHNHAVNGGGDTQCAGERAPGEPWRIGLVHPLIPGQLTAVVALRDGAVATSGITERGAHVINPMTGQPAIELASISVVGTSLTRVDAYATAGLAMGSKALQWIETLDDYEGLVVSGTGRARWSRGFVGTPAQD